MQIHVYYNYAKQLVIVTSWDAQVSVGITGKISHWAVHIAAQQL